MDRKSTRWMEPGGEPDLEQLPPSGPSRTGSALARSQPLADSASKTTGLRVFPAPRPCRSGGSPHSTGTVRLWRKSLVRWLAGWLAGWPTRREAPPGRGAGRVLPPRERGWSESRRRFGPPSGGEPRIRPDDGVPNLFEDGFPCGALSPQACCFSVQPRSRSRAIAPHDLEPEQVHMAPKTAPPCPGAAIRAVLMRGGGGGGNRTRVRKPSATTSTCVSGLWREPAPEGAFPCFASAPHQPGESRPGSYP